MKHFGLILTLFTFTVTMHAQNVVTEIHGKQVKVDTTVGSVAKIEKVVERYSTKINRELDKVLAYNPMVLDKTKGASKYQSNIGDLFAQIILDKSNKVLMQREKLTADISVFNHGGIRAILPIGKVTTRNAFEIMPFENSSVVLEVKGQIILDFINYFIKEKKPHPIGGMTFVIDAENKPKNIKIGSADLDLEKTYYIATNDYLANGGDKMDFFLKASKKFVLDYKLRDMLIDYFTDVEMVTVPQVVKIVKE